MAAMLRALVVAALMAEVAVGVRHIMNAPNGAFDLNTNFIDVWTSNKTVFSLISALPPAPLPDFPPDSPTDLTPSFPFFPPFFLSPPPAPPTGAAGCYRAEIGSTLLALQLLIAAALWI